MLTVGLTGGIGSGKSEVTRIFHQLGIPVIDADVIAHQLVQPGTETLSDVVAVFGETILASTGELDRAKLAGIVFNKPDMKQQLETIIHPRVREQIPVLEAAASEGKIPPTTAARQLLEIFLKRHEKWD